MPFLRLRDQQSGEVRTFESSAVRIGRDPSSELAIFGDAAKVVSTSHARLFYDAGHWWVEDLGSRNGTYLGVQRLVASARQPLAVGDVVGLGESGPRFKVEAAGQKHLEETITEAPRSARPSAATVKMSGLDESLPAPSAPPAPTRAAAPPPPPPPPPPLRIVFREARTGDQHEGTGGRIRIGRGQECEVRPVAAGDTAVSRVHAEIVLKPDGSAVLRDARSRNGTFVNGAQVHTEHTLKPGDRILLGDGGPELIVERIVAPGARPEPQAKLAAVGETPGAPAKGRRSFGGKGATLFFKEMMAETDRRTSKRLRWIVWSFVGLLLVATGGFYWWSEQRVRQTTATLQAEQREVMVAQRRTADSLRQAAQGEYERLRVALDSARGSSAPAGVVESLRTAFNDAKKHTTALEASLQRAQTSLSQQLAAGDSARRQAQAELQRLQGELNRANNSSVSSAQLDSLRKAMREAQDRASSIEGQLRAVKSVDFTSLWQANQGAVGLVITFARGGAWNGTGFVITKSGYLVTNRHVVQPEEHEKDSQGKDSLVIYQADSVFVVMADEQYMLRASIVAVSPLTQPDLAIVRIANYKGPVINKINWDVTRVRPGEPGALIGFPAGASLALDQTQTVRTSFSQGSFSKVTPELIQFGGFTIEGSSGSPVFNANGEIVAVHAAGLRQGPGLAFGVPVKFVIPLLPAEVKAELGLP